MKIKPRLGFKLHRNQWKVFRDRSNVVVLVAARRFGKTLLGMAKAIEAVFSIKAKPSSPLVRPAVLVLCPTLKQAKGLWWVPLEKLFEGPGKYFVKRIHKSDLRIEFKGNFPDLVVRGATDSKGGQGGEGLRGFEWWFIVADEFADISAKVWKEAIVPAKKGKLLIIGTPKGKNNHLYEYAQLAQSKVNWAYYHYTTLDNPTYPKQAVEEAEQLMSDRAFKQEFKADFLTYEGQVYDHLDDHHFQEIPPLTTYKNIILGGDWGQRNPALAVIGITPTNCYHLLDIWEPNKEAGELCSTDDFLNKAAALCRTYDVSYSYLPDDQPGNIQQARRLGESKNIKGLIRCFQVNRNKPNVQEGNDIINSLFKCDRFLIRKSLPKVESYYRSYRFAVDASGNSTGKPLKVDDHVLDAVRAAIATIEYAHYRRIVQPQPKQNSWEEVVLLAS